MQLVLVRHAQPRREFTTTGPADPDLTDLGIEQATRVPAALTRLEVAGHRITRVVSSPQRRARETAGPTADKLDLSLDIHPGLAEYDADLPLYIPIEDAKQQFRATYERIKAGYLPEQIDGPAFVDRVRAAVGEITAAADHSDTVVAFAHGGVINVLLQDVLDLDRPLTFPIDYCSITRILYSRTGRRTAATVNENGHVWDLLPRNLAAD
ncbi:histidine phosphatase family protein [Nocardia terpenica]|uniref:histidine phosphatase family protein n=1 Tax=Nocardia terpenica TaxID=455432 RepID=UPI0018944EB7|nr:histidine phosphatase family protein [Nocardia terpenica]MBF6066003.1 histidine phosphatase family protein [Nocardia terpenica]MBF6109070.1 histidine phosphatase family protein [Nocardia terpenica]MBF6116247.1 histidine phosphatase family protein [Nocardia terpenica]MBF6123248.1 histidine phosphatase family protein [Nocardia terpenica]MBF6156569.1 histidine phosphatase family protein [Nocardia terpenica]